MNFIKSSIALAITATMASTGVMAQDKPEAFTPVAVVAV